MFKKPPTPRKTAPSIRDTSSVFERESRSIIEKNFTKLTDGVLLTNIALTTATTRVVHTLSRPYVGFKIVDKTASGDVWRDSTDLLRPEEAIPLIASTPMTVSLWVF